MSPKRETAIMQGSYDRLQDSVVVSAPVSQSKGTGFDPRQRKTCPGLTKPSILFKVVKLVSVSAVGEKSFVRPLGGECRLLLAPFHASICLWSVSRIKWVGLWSFQTRVARPIQKNQNCELRASVIQVYGILWSIV